MMPRGTSEPSEGTHVNISAVTPCWWLYAKVGIRASSGHLALQLLEAPASFAFAIIDKLDRSVTVKRPGDERSLNSRRWSHRHSSRHCRGAPSI